jgi:hypothetical protein
MAYRLFPSYICHLTVNRATSGVLFVIKVTAFALGSFVCPKGDSNIRPTAVLSG